MNGVMEAAGGSLLQLGLFSLIPVAWWLITRKKSKLSFFAWIGLKKPSKPKAKPLLAALSLLAACSAAAMLFLNPLMGESATTMYSEGDFTAQAAACILLFSFVKTGLSEELLFRGFLAKRFIGSFGFVKGSIAQAVIFGLAHSFVILSGCGWPLTAATIVFAAISGGLFAYLNEKVFGGSIVPSWVLHGLGNCVPAFLLWAR